MEEMLGFATMAHHRGLRPPALMSGKPWPAANVAVREVAPAFASTGSTVTPRVDAAFAVVMATVAASASLRPRIRRSLKQRSCLRATEEDGESAKVNSVNSELLASAPPLESERNMDYSTLRDLLAAEDFKAADAETRRLLIVVAGLAAEKRGWVYFSEVKSIPVADMTTIDGLWQHFSKGKFGYAAQKKIWRSCRSQFDKFAEQISWFTDKWKNRNWPDEFIYSLEAPVGHLPLTNCIRGAQVLDEILNHPAFEKKKTEKAKSKPASKPGKRSALSML